MTNDIEFALTPIRASDWLLLYSNSGSLGRRVLYYLELYYNTL